MTKDEFADYLGAHEKQFQAWGEHVVQRVIEGLEGRLGHNAYPDYLKIIPKPRVKSVESALGKLARKGYTDPVGQMTDLVGVRFVVLLSSHISLVCDVIESQSDWDVRKARDFQEEISSNPKIFDYQSQHYEVRPVREKQEEHEGELCCEVQIRTLFQHAYAEIVHDTLYKPDRPIPPGAERQIARSMALMETTDELFCNTMDLISNVNRPRNELLEDLVKVYREDIGGELLRPDRKTNEVLIDEFKDVLHEGLASEIRAFAQKKGYVYRRISERANEDLFFAQPCILFVYWLVDAQGPDEVFRAWPLPGYATELELVCADLGRWPTLG